MLLAKGAIEQSTGGAGFYSNVFVVPKHMGGLSPVLNFRQFNHYIHIPTLRCLLSDRYRFLFSWEILLFLLISWMHINIFVLLSITITF